MCSCTLGICQRDGGGLLIHRQKAELKYPSHAAFKRRGSCEHFFLCRCRCDGLISWRVTGV